MPFTQELLKYVTKPYFVETGTYRGDMIDTLLQHTYVPEQMISLELSKFFFERCKQRFEKNSNVKIHHANSKVDLYPIIQQIHKEITFWLDGHWSGVDDVGEDTEIICPILQELDQIKMHPIKTHTIIIDDIRLMNLSKDRYAGFDVSLSQILDKILAINPNYTIKYYDDCTSEKDILVASIKPECVHNYLTTCQTNPQPPGLADFLRGTIALYNLSKQYGYTLKINRTHPIFRYLKGDDQETDLSETIEFLPPMSYEEIGLQLNRLFSSNKSFQVMTNSFYTHHTVNWGEITEECRQFLKHLLSPSSILLDHIHRTFGSFINQSFNAIHIRTDDYNIHQHHFDETKLNDFLNPIRNQVKSDPNSYLVITDCSVLGNRLQKELGVLYVDTKKIHLGDLIHQDETSILDTLADFFMLSRAKEIYYVNDSGFSRIVSIVYNIQYIRL